jgi:hypothetical protein
MRNPSPYQQYKKNLARVLWEGGKSNNLTRENCRCIRKIFKSFHPDYHADIVAYPDWLNANYVEFTDTETRQRVKNSEGPAFFLFSEDRITQYLQALYP